MKQKLLIAVAVVAIISAIAVAAYPLLANLYNDAHQSVVRTQYEEAVKTMDDSHLRELRENAEAYFDMHTQHHMM